MCTFCNYLSHFNLVCAKLWVSGVLRHTAVTDGERSGIRGEPAIYSFMKHCIAECDFCGRRKTNSLLIGTIPTLSYPTGRQPLGRRGVVSTAFLFLPPFLKGQLSPRSLGSCNLFLALSGTALVLLSKAQAHVSGLLASLFFIDLFAYSVVHEPARVSWRACSSLAIQLLVVLNDNGSTY